MERYADAYRGRCRDPQAVLPGLPGPRLLPRRRRGQWARPRSSTRSATSSSTSTTRSGSGCRIEHVFLTHFHADFVAGHLELRERTGATIHLGVAARAEYRVHADGRRASVLSWASVRLEVLETPGHSPESISILVYDPGHGDHQPVRGADRRHAVHRRRRPARPARLARLERRRAREHALRLACTRSSPRFPTTRSSTRRTAPARCAASTCRRDTVSTIGVQRAYNYAMQPMSRERFIEIVTADQPDAPAYFTYDAVLNTREHPTLDQALERELSRRCRSARRCALDRPRARSCSTRATRRSSRAPTSRQHQHRPRRQLRDLVRHAPRPRRADRRWSPSPGARSRRRRGSGGSGSTTSPATWPAGCSALDARAGADRAHRADHGGLARRAARWSDAAARDRRAHAAANGRSTGSTARSTCRCRGCRSELDGAAERPGARRLLLERLPLGDRREPAAPRRPRRCLRPGRRSRRVGCGRGCNQRVNPIG